MDALYVSPSEGAMYLRNSATLMELQMSQSQSEMTDVGLVILKWRLI
jgi:hypothetical protein